VVHGLAFFLNAGVQAVTYHCLLGSLLSPGVNLPHLPNFPEVILVWKVI
jgi:hypothetical protein